MVGRLFTDVGLHVRNPAALPAGRAHVRATTGVAAAGLTEFSATVLPLSAILGDANETGSPKFTASPGHSGQRRDSEYRSASHLVFSEAFAATDPPADAPYDSNADSPPPGFDCAAVGFLDGALCRRCDTCSRKDVTVSGATAAAMQLSVASLPYEVAFDRRRA